MRYLVIALALLFVTPANARHYHHYRHHAHYARAYTPPQQDFFGSFFGLQPTPPTVRYQSQTFTPEVHRARLSTRPRDCYGIAWCGCYLRHQLGIADSSLNLAANWAHVGHATNAHVGAIIVWRHHVGQITGMTARGAPIVLSGNSGRGGITERPLSLRGVIAYRDL